jgi:hypothetical protein
MVCPARHSVQEGRSHDVHKRPVPACPVLAEWPRCVTSYTANDEQRAIVSNVAYNTREDVLFVNEHSIDDMRDYLVAHNWTRGAQPSKGHLVGQLLAAFLLSQPDNLIERFCYQSSEVLTIHMCSPGRTIVWPLLSGDPFRMRRTDVRPMFWRPAISDLLTPAR